MDKQKAYKIVLDDIVSSGCGLFIGRYDAIHGDRNFMHGISTVMEYLAYEAGSDEFAKFERMFFDNLMQSEKEVKVHGR